MNFEEVKQHTWIPSQNHIDHKILYPYCKFYDTKKQILFEWPFILHS